VGALLLELARLRLELLERLLDRLELRVGEVEQRPLAGRQRLAGDRLDALRPLALAALDELELLLGGAPLRGAAVVGGPDRGARPEVDGGGAGEHSDQEQCDRHGRGTIRSPSDGIKKTRPLRVRRPAGAEMSDPATPKSYRIRRGEPIRGPRRSSTPL